MINRYLFTCWYALAPLPLKPSNHLLLCALLLLLLLLQLHHPLHQHLHLHRSINQLEKRNKEKGLGHLLCFQPYINNVNCAMSSIVTKPV